MALIQRFLTSFRGEDDGRSGLIEKNDATIWYRKPDGSEAEIGNGGSSPSVSGVFLPAQILTLFSAPITLVTGTPGAVTIPETFASFYKSGTTPYFIPGFPLFDVADLAAQGNALSATQFGNLIAAGPPDEFSIDFLIDSTPNLFNASDTSSVLGKGITLFMPGSDPTSGDLAVAYELTYRVIVPAT